MKTKMYLIGLLAGIMAFWSCENDALEMDLKNSKEVVHKSKLQNKVLRSEALINNVIGNPAVRKLQIYTPPGYKKNGSQSYPVVYLLHGLPFSEKSYIDMSTWDDWIDPNGIFQTYPDFPTEGFKDWVDNLIADGKIEPMIIVMPNAANELYGFSFYTNSVLNGNFEDFIVHDLVNYMDMHYNTIAHSNGRAIIGNSQGGYAAFKLGMKHPDVFGAVASHSGLIVMDVMLSLGPIVVAENPEGFLGPDPTKFLTSAGYAMSAAWSPNLSNPPFFVDLPFEFPSGNVIPDVAIRWYEQDPFMMLDTYADNFRSLNGIYFDCGAMDELNICAGDDYMKQKLNAYEIDYTYEEFIGGHFNKIFSRLEVSLGFCSDKMNM